MSSLEYRKANFLNIYYLSNKNVKKAVRNFLLGVEMLGRLNIGSVYWNFIEFNACCVELVKILCPSFTHIKTDLIPTLYVWNVGDLYVPSEIAHEFVPMDELYITNDITRNEHWDNSTASRFQTGC